MTVCLCEVLRETTSCPPCEACPARSPASCRVIGPPLGQRARRPALRPDRARRRATGPSGWPDRGSASGATVIWRSANSLTSTADSSASSGGSRRVSAIGLHPAVKVGQAQPPVARRACARSPAAAARAAAMLCKVEQRRFGRRVARQPVGILDHQRGRLDQRGHVRRRQALRRQRSRPPLSAAQTCARCVLPDPSGPTSSSRPPGQSRQPSSAASASAFDGETKKSAAPQCLAHGQVEGQLADHSRVSSVGAAQRGCALDAAIEQALPGTARSRSASARRCIAATGTATSMPTKPKTDPKADSANSSQTGCRPTDLPTSLGVRMLPSTNCPKAKIAGDDADLTPSRPRTGTAPARWPASRRPASRHRE